MDRIRYALAEWSVEKRPKGWYFSKTYGKSDLHGPYSSAISVSLMIARELLRELTRRHSLTIDSSPTEEKSHGEEHERSRSPEASE